MIKEGLRQGCILSPTLFSLFLMDLAVELERKGLGVRVNGTWMGTCCFADDIIGSAEALPILCVSDFCERERERERDACDVIRYHAEIASDHAYDYLDGASTQRVDAF